MRLLNSTKKDKSKLAEATTDESQRSASSWRNKFSVLHWPRVNRHCKQQRKVEMELPNMDTVDDNGTGSVLDLFQTLMSNAAPLPQSGPDVMPADITAGNNRNTMNYWHTNDPNFLPTAYPLTRTDPRAQPKAQWGSLNLAASAALVAGQLKRFEDGSDKQPRFRLGPRVPAGGKDEDARSMASSDTDRSRSAAVDTNEPKYAFISQDGKLVEREMCHWPKHSQPKLNMRYKLCEPYASNYGKKSCKRGSMGGQKFTLPRTRWIYERPIFLLPRAIVNENKRRLLSRHMLKDRYESSPSYRLPCKITLNESEECQRYREYQTLKYIKETKHFHDHQEKAKAKANEDI